MGFIPLRLLHLGDGALRVADVRHTKPSRFSAINSAAQRKNGLTRAFAGRRLAYSGVCGTRPRKKQGYPADTQPETRNAKRM